MFPRSVAKIPMVKELRLQLDQGIPSARRHKAFIDDARVFRKNFSGASGTPGSIFFDWQSPQHRVILAEMANAYLDKSGDTFWPNSPKAPNYNKWQIGTHRDELRRLLMQLFFRLNNQSIRNERHKEKRQNASSSPNTKSRPLSRGKGFSPAEPIEVDSIEVSSTTSSLAESSQPNNEVSDPPPNKYTSAAFGPATEDPSPITAAGTAGTRTAPPPPTTVADPYEVPTSQSSGSLNNSQGGSQSHAPDKRKSEAEHPAKRQKTQGKSPKKQRASRLVTLRLPSQRQKRPRSFPDKAASEEVDEYLKTPAPETAPSSVGSPTRSAIRPSIEQSTPHIRSASPLVAVPETNSTVQPQASETDQTDTQSHRDFRETVEHYSKAFTPFSEFEPPAATMQRDGPYPFRRPALFSPRLRAEFANMAPEPEQPENSPRGTPSAEATAPVDGTSSTDETFMDASADFEPGGRRQYVVPTRLMNTPPAVNAEANSRAATDEPIPAATPPPPPPSPQPRKRIPETTFEYRAIQARHPGLVERSWEPEHGFRDLTLAQLMDEVPLDFTGTNEGIRIRLLGPRGLDIASRPILTGQDDAFTKAKKRCHDAIIACVKEAMARGETTLELIIEIELLNSAKARQVGRDTPAVEAELSEIWR